MNDASGHYSTGFLYGNNYWTGSYRLCESVYVGQNSRNPQAKRIKDSEITTINGYTVDSTVGHENPPFVPTFYVVKVRLNATQISPVVCI